MTATNTNRNQELSELGFALEIINGPRGEVERQADNKSWPHIAYRVRLVFDKHEVLETDYNLGIGHVDISKPLLRLSDDEAAMLRVWRNRPGVEFKDKLLQARVAALAARQQKVVPQLDAVLYSLLMDGEAFFNAQSFEDWASELGYDKYSRKSEAIYKACDDIGRKIAARVSDKVLAKAQDIVRDL